MRKILIITTISGFLPKFEMNDVNIVQEMGYEVHYASNFNNPIYEIDEEELKRKGIVLHHIDIEKSVRKVASNIKAINQIKKIIESEGIDLIHCHNPMGGVTARFAGKISHNKPYIIYTAHGFHFFKGAPLFNWLAFGTAERIMAHSTDAIVTINTEDYQQAGRFRLKKNGFVEQIPGVGVDTDKFKRRIELRDEVREELGIPRNAFHIVTAAELNDNKNQIAVIEAIAQLDFQDIYYSLCGKGPNEQKLKERIEQLGLENKVRLLNYRTDMDRVLQSADAFAFTSIREGLGIAAVEALLCGVPLIAADNRGTREYAINNVNAVICNARDIKSIKWAIYKLYSDKSYREELSNNCRESALRFSKENTRKVMKRVYGLADHAISK